MILRTLVAVALPFLFLALVRWLDLYATGSFKGVLVCIVYPTSVQFSRPRQSQ